MKNALLAVLAVVSLAVAAVAQDKKDEKAAGKPDIPCDLTHRSRSGESVFYDVIIDVKSGFGSYQNIYTIETRGLRPNKDGSMQVSITLHRLRETNIVGKEKTVFDSSQTAGRDEDEEYGAIRKILGKNLCSANVAPTGEVSRLIFSEDADVLWKKEGSQTLGRARDYLGQILVRLPGKIAKVGDTWEEERNPVGEQIPFSLKMKHKLAAFDPKTGLATVSLAEKPTAGKSDMNITKSEIGEFTENVVVDCVNFRMVSLDFSGKMKARSGEGDIAVETTYDLKMSVKTRGQ